VNEVGSILLEFDRSELEDLAGLLTRTLQVGFSRDRWFYRTLMELLGLVGSPKADRAIPLICQYFEAAPRQVSAAAKTDCPEDLTTGIEEASDDIRKSAMRALSQSSPLALLASKPTIELAATDPVLEVLALANKTLKRMEGA